MMNNFCKILKNIDILFGQVVYYFFITKFQSGGLPHDHGLVGVKNALQFGISSNSEVKIFVDTYLTTDQTIFQKEIHNAQIHQHKQTCKKKWQQICHFLYLKPLMKYINILLPLNEGECTSILFYRNLDF